MRSREAVGILVTCVLGSFGARSQAQITSTGLPIATGSYPSFDGSRWIFASPETGVDWNGDADLNDRVLLGVDESTFAITNIGLAVIPNTTPFFVRPNAVYATVSEAAQGGIDRNGDGDALDQVPARWDFATGTAFYPSFVTSWLDVAADDSVALFIRGEKPGLDLNGDGDFADQVLHEWIPGAAAPINLQYVLGSARLLPGGDCLALVSEALNHADLNGDGDQVDPVTLQYRASTGIWSWTGMSAELFTPVGSLIPVAERESYTGIDLNGDGDTSDAIIGVWNAATGTRVSSGLDGDNVTLQNGRVVFNAREGGFVDLDGDGDKVDRVLCALDASTGAVTVIAEANRPQSTTVTFRHDGNRVAYRVSEPWLASQGLPADANGDGDTVDFVLTVRDLATGQVDRGRACFDFGASFVLVGDYVGYHAVEGGEGNTDLNANGFVAGEVFVIDTFLGESRSTSLAGDAFAATGGSAGAGRMILYCNEANVGYDMNGDGDKLDYCIVDADLLGGTLRNPGIGSLLTGSADSRLGLGVAEYFEQADLNGDGDQLDDIFHVVVIPPGWSGSVVNHGAGCPTAASPAARTSLFGDLAGGGRAVLSVSGAVPGQNALIVIGLGPASIPTGLGCPLLTAPVLPSVIGPLPLASNGLFLGSIALPVVIPFGLTGLGARLQSFVTDPIFGMVPSNAVEFTLGL